MITLALALLFQEEILSGPQKGEKLAPFKVVDVATAKEASAELGPGPALVVFIHELTRPAAQCFRPLDEYAAQQQGLKTQFVYLSEDQDSAERHLPTVVKSVRLQSKLGVSIEGKEGPGAYGLNRKVTLTVLVANDGVVTANFAILSPNETDAPKILRALDDLLFPTPEAMRAEIGRLREELRKLRSELDGYRKPVDLSGIYRRVIQRDATEAQVDAAIADLEKAANADPKQKKGVVDQLVLMIEKQYGTAYARKKMEELKARLEKM